MPLLFYILLVLCSPVDWSWGWAIVACILWALE